MLLKLSHALERSLLTDLGFLSASFGANVTAPGTT